MWSAFLEPKLQLLNADCKNLRSFGQELVHFAIHHDPTGVALWCDGEHGFDPYDFAELNLQRGFQADHGANRVLVKRCMTAFNWELALDQHIGEKLETTQASMVIMSPYDALFRHPELADWEQEDYVHHSLQHLTGVAKRYQVPLLALADVTRLWRTHPILAQMMQEGTQRHWRIDQSSGHWSAVEQVTGKVIDSRLHHQGTLLDFHDVPRENAGMPYSSESNANGYRSQQCTNQPLGAY